MKRVISPSAIFKYNGKLVRVVGINEGQRSILLEYLDKNNNPECPHCGKPIEDYQFDVIEGCLNFQGGAEPIETLTV